MFIHRDPKSVRFLASKDKLVWKELLSSEVAFQNREDRIAFVFKNEETYYHYALQFEKSKDTMHIGKVGLVESYTASCAANLYHKITGVSIPYYETMDPTSVPSITPSSSESTNLRSYAGRCLAKQIHITCSMVPQDV